MKIYGAQLTGSIASTGNPVVTGSLTVSGNLTAQQFIVSSSVTFLTTSFSSGSTRFGDSSDDNHNFTGSVVMTGSLTVVTNGNEFQVNAGGVNIGNALTDNHVISGSIRINPNGLFVSSSGFVGIGTTSPGQLLEVVGGEIKAGRVDSTNEGGQVSFGRSTDNNTSWYIDAYGNVASPQLRFVNVSDSLVAMTITGSNVGIGTTNPGIYKISIVNNGANAYLGISNQGTTNGDRQLRIGFGGNGSDTFATIQGTRYNIADDVFVAIQSGGGQVGIGTTSIKSLLGSNTKLTVTGGGGTGNGSAGGSIGSVAGSGTGALNLGISINGLDGGMTLMFLASRNTAGGTSTASAVYIISFYYSDENFPVITYLGGTNNFVSFSTSGNNLTATNSLGGNHLYSWFANK